MFKNWLSHLQTDGILILNHTASHDPKNFNSVLLFPSYLLHRVRPVTKGIRKSLVLWMATRSSS